MRKHQSCRSYGECIDAHAERNSQLITTSFFILFYPFRIFGLSFGPAEPLLMQPTVGSIYHNSPVLSSSLNSKPHHNDFMEADRKTRRNSELQLIQSQRVADHGNRAEGHGDAGDHRTQ